MTEERVLFLDEDWEDGEEGGEAEEGKESGESGCLLVGLLLGDPRGEE